MNMVQDSRKKERKQLVVQVDISFSIFTLEL